MKIVFEKIVPAAGSSFAILDKQAPAFDGRFHFHPEIEITLIERSTGRRVVGDSIQPFAPGDLVLIGENLPHQYVSDRMSERATDESLARAKVIQFRADFLGDTWLDLPEFKRIATIINHSSRGLAFSADATRDASGIIANLFSAAEAKRVLLLLELLDVLSRDHKMQPIASAGYLSKINMREGESIDRALEYLNTNFKEPITLEELSDHLHVSPATCNRLLQKSIGRSFKTALIEIRISHACRLLLETEQSILDIAFGSGFTNLSNFNRRFKELKGNSPREYRNLMRPAGNELAVV
jgi:AraC-like DNA-binding protein